MKILELNYHVHSEGRLVGAFVNESHAEEYQLDLADVGIDSEIIHCTCSYKDERECPTHGISAQLNRSQME